MNLKLKKTISTALTLIMLISCFSSGIQAFAGVTQVIFLQADGSESRVYNPTEINSDTYELVGGEYGTKWYTTGAYVSPNMGIYPTIEHGITVRGDVSLIIRDNLHLSVKGGIYVAENSTLTIYGQSNAPQGVGHYSTGVLSAVATDDAAGIGGKEGAVGGHIVINSGVVQAHGEDSAGIGGGYDEDSGFQSVTINGGVVSASGDGGGAGIGDGKKNKKSGDSVITINGGDVHSIGNDGGAGIGGGSSSECKDASIVINGGVIFAQGGDNGAGIGGGENSRDWRSIAINDGEVEAIGGDGGAGIGGGENRGNGVIRISGGTVVAKAGGYDEDAGEYGAGIGGGVEGDQDNTIYISGGDVKAYGGICGAGIGGGADGDGNDVYISGGNVFAQAGAWADGIGGGRCTKETTPWQPTVDIPKCGSKYISGGIVTAKTDPDSAETENAAAISCWKEDEVVISGGAVFAYSTGIGAGIGSGRTKGAGTGTIKISDAYVVATSVDGAGIGTQGTWEDSHIKNAGGNIEISNSYVFAASSRKGAGIGGGNDADGGKVTIKNSVVDAFGGSVDYNWYVEHGPVDSRGEAIQFEGSGSGYGIDSPVSGMIASAILTALSQLVYSADYRGAGIGGGDEGAGADVTIENSTVFAVGGGDEAHAFGHGHDTNRTNGTLNLGDDLKVSSGSSEETMATVQKDARVSAAWNTYYVKVEPCAHEGATYDGTPEGHCVSACPCCAASYNENDLAPHTFGDNKVCTVCGWQGVTVAFDPGDYSGSAEPVVIGKGLTYMLPDAMFTECEEHGYMQTGWATGGAAYAFGDRITVNADTTLTATYQMANDIVIVDSDNGSASANASYAVPGTAVTVTAAPDTGCRLTKIWMRANGETVYVRNETDGKGLPLTHTFTMPQNGNVAVYTTFRKNEYQIRFDDPITVRVNGSAADTAVYGDTIEVGVPASDEIKGIVWAETDANGEPTGERHALALSAAGEASFPLDVCGDILITANTAHEHDGVVFYPWGDSVAERNSLPQYGCHYLTHDVTLTGTYSPRDGETHICLNGHSVRISDNFTDQTLIDVHARHLFIHDHEDAGVIDGCGKCRLVNLTNSRFTLYGGTLTGGSALSGSVVNITETNGFERLCSFTMHGGVITGNTGSSKGVLNVSGAPFTIDGGAIVGNTAPAAVYISDRCTLTLSGDPVIKDNVPEGNSYTCNLIVGKKAIIEINGALSPDALIGVTANGSPNADYHIPVTDGLPGRGTLANFCSDDKTRALGLYDGEAAVGSAAKVCFDKNGGSGCDMPEETVPAGADYTLPPCLFTAPAGKAFDGWKIGVSDAVRQAGETICVTEDVTFYAVWKEGGEQPEPEIHRHRWEILPGEGDPSEVTVRCVNTTLGGDALCNETELKTVELQTDGQSGATYTKAYDGKAVTAVACKQKAYMWTTAFPDENLIRVSPVTYYDETGAKLDTAPVNVGVYTAKATVEPVRGQGDTVVMTQTIRIVKGAAPAIVVTGKENLPLTNADQPLVEATDATGYGLIRYRVNGGDWSYRLPEAKESGDYTIEWYFESPCYESVNSKDDPAVVTASISELHEHNGVRFTRWTDTDNLPTSGNYFLANDVVWANGPWTITGELNLCLFGHTVMFGKRGYNPDTNIFVNSGGKLNLYGDGGGRLVGASDISVNVTEGGTLSTWDVCFDSFASSKGAIYLEGGTFHMNGGSIINTPEMQAAVNNWGGTFHMNGGVIRNNTGTGVSLNAESVFNLSGNAQICQNAIWGVNVSERSSINISGSPVITDNEYGNVFLAGSSKINVTGELRGARVGVYTEDEPYNGAIVFTSGYGADNAGTPASESFFSDRDNDDRFFIGTDDDGEAIFAVHDHSFAVELAPGRTDKAYAHCVNEGCPLGDHTALTYTLTSEDKVYSNGSYYRAELTAPSYQFSELNVSGIHYTRDGAPYEGLNPSEAGDYTASVTITGAQQSVTITTAYSVTKKTAEVKVLPGQNLVYNGGNQTIATFEGVEGGIIQYAVDSKEESAYHSIYSADLPPSQPFGKKIQAASAGQHTVYYYVENYRDYLPLGSFAEPIELGVLIKANVTLYGKTDNEHTTMLVDPSAFTAPECPFEAPEGKAFGSWRVDSQTAGDILEAGDAYAFTKNIKLYPVWVDPPHEHTYGTPAWRWATDHSSATAVFTCACGDEQTATDVSTLFSQVSPADCENDQLIKYLAAVEFDGGIYTAETEELAVENTKLNHDYQFDSFVWSEDGMTAEAKLVCVNNAAHVTFAAAEMSREEHEASCETDAYTVCTASYDGHSEEKTVSLPNTAGHVYGDPVWIWTEDFTAAVTFTCKNGDDAQTPAVTVTSTVTRQPTATETGEKTYTASTQFGGEVYTDFKTEVLPVTGGPDDPATPTDPTEPVGPTAPDTQAGDNLCKWDNTDHGTSFFGRLIRFFHSILYFFAHLFGRR